MFKVVGLRKFTEAGESKRKKTVNRNNKNVERKFIVIYYLHMERVETALVRCCSTPYNI